jgi:DNA-damage-inducible protein J
MKYTKRKRLEVNNMARSAMINARTEQDLKTEVEGIFKTLGLSTTDAINIFYRQVKLRHGLPFPVEIPNETTLQAFRDTEEGKGLVTCKDVNDMFESLGV